MRELIVSFLIVSAVGCRCSPTEPVPVTLRLKNGTNAAIFVDDTDERLGLGLQRASGGGNWESFEETLKCACRSCDQICSAGACPCDGGTAFVRKVQPGDTFQRTWSGVVQVKSPSGCADGCLLAENAPADETFRLQLCFQLQVLGVDPPDGGRLAAVYPKPDQTCVEKEFRPADGEVEVGPRKGAGCTSPPDCVGVGELCLGGSCTASCPANGFPVLGAGWALRIDSTDQGFFTGTPDAGPGVAVATGEITSVIYNGGTMTVRLKRLGAAGEVLTGAVFVTLPMGNAAPLAQGAKVTVRLVDGSTGANPENRAVLIRDLDAGALLFAADHAQQGVLLAPADTAPFTVSFSAPLVGCRFNECGKQLFYQTRFTGAGADSKLDPGKSALLTVPQGPYRVLNVSSGTYATTTCKLFDIRPYAVWREKGP